MTDTKQLRAGWRAAILAHADEVIRDNPEFTTEDDWRTCTDPAGHYSRGRAWDREMEDEDNTRAAIRDTARAFRGIAVELVEAPEIAAASDLLGAAQDALQWIAKPDKVVDKLRAAIAKAGG